MITQPTNIPKIRILSETIILYLNRHVFVILIAGLHLLKLDLYDKNKPTNKLKIRILSETSILYLIRHTSFILNVGLLL